MFVSLIYDFFRIIFFPPSGFSFKIWTDADSLACFLRASKLHDLFVPYRTELMSDVTTKGYPVTRAMWLAFPKDPIAAAIDGPDQFMIGSEFLVAPVTDPGTTSVTVSSTSNHPFLNDGLRRTCIRSFFVCTIHHF